MHTAEIILECNIEDLSTLHRVLDSLESVDVACISVSLHGYRPGCASELLAFSTGCALRSRHKRLSIYGRELLGEIDDALLVQEMAAINNAWRRLSAELQAFHGPHLVDVLILSSPVYF